MATRKPAKGMANYKLTLHTKTSNISSEGSLPNNVALEVYKIVCSGELSKPNPLPGIAPWQEPKYTTDGISFINRASGELIPHDEPVFIFRARDCLSVQALESYLGQIHHRDPSVDHYVAVAKRLQSFKKFAEEHPERMKYPDTELCQDEGCPQSAIAHVCVSKTPVHPAVAAVQYAISPECDNAQLFLEQWNEGDWPGIAATWDNVPEEIYPEGAIRG